MLTIINKHVQYKPRYVLVQLLYIRCSRLQAGCGYIITLSSTTIWVPTCRCISCSSPLSTSSLLQPSVNRCFNFNLFNKCHRLGLEDLVDVGKRKLSVCRPLCPPYSIVACPLSSNLERLLSQNQGHAWQKDRYILGRIAALAECDLLLQTDWRNLSVFLSVCLSVGLSRPWALQKRPTRSSMLTRMGPRNYVDRVKWRHISVVAIRSPFCRSTPSYCA